MVSASRRTSRDERKERKRSTDEEEDEDKEQTIEKAAEDLRYPMLSFSQSDMAFRDDLLVTGSYHGFNIYRIDEEGLPKLITSVVCPGGQGDVSIVGDLLIYVSRADAWPP